MISFEPMLRGLAGGALAGLLAAATPSAARAACYEGVGCTDRAHVSARQLARLADCDILWEMRNGIYKERGYCFRTQRGIASFGNAGCQHDDMGVVPLNAYERANVAAIQQAERMKGCPR